MSRTILNQPGAEQLPDVKGRMLALVEGQNRAPMELQGYYLSDDMVKTVIAGLSDRQYSRLTELERELVRYAIEELAGEFKVESLYEAFKGQISKRRLTTLAQVWERRGWLTEPQHRADPRRVTERLLAEVEGATEAMEGSPEGELW
jgi:DNA segregation ATPase FtsK/SpoIIIE-like protein